VNELKMITGQEKRKPPLRIIGFSVISLLFSFSSVAISESRESETSESDTVQKVLSQIFQCSKTIVIRSQNLTKEEQAQACKMLGKQEDKFHQLFNTRSKPVKDDLNKNLRVNVYQAREDFVKYAGNHFNMPTDNGGMYLEGFPDQDGNQAEFITYQRGDVIWNLRHEYIHYLDGRFNLYGDFCDSLHDSHSPPENCAKPAPLFPHTVWWSEGIAEYIAKGKDHRRAFDIVNSKPEEFKLSQIFNTGYVRNSGGARIYFWGYFAARFMMENQRDKVEVMLSFLRDGDYPRYQALIKSWDNSMDKEFSEWLSQLLRTELSKES